MIPILDNSDRARRVVLFFWIYLGLEVLNTAITLVYGNLEMTLSDDSYISVIVQFFTASFVFLVAAIGIGTMITFLQWFRRAYHNLEKAGYPNEYTNGWAVGFWFIPFANWFFPYKIAKEIWYKTQKEYKTDIESHGLVRSWWLLFVLSHMIVQNISQNRRIGFADSTVWVLFSSLLEIAAILAAIFFIKKVASFEEPFRVHITAETVGQHVPEVEEKDIEEEFY